MPAPGRPSSATHPTVAVRHLDTGQAVAWAEGEFSGDGMLGHDARAILRAGESVRFGHDRFPMTDGPHGAAAAMLAACRGRGVIVRGLDGLRDGIEAGESLVRDARKGER